MKNVQIGFDETLLELGDRYAASTRSTRSAVVREALKKWLREKEIRSFEVEWIEKLKQVPEDTNDSEAWLAVEHWEEESVVRHGLHWGKPRRLHRRIHAD